MKQTSLTLAQRFTGLSILSPNASGRTRAVALRTLLLLTLFLLVTSGRSASARGVCPAVGADTDCGIIITVTDTGATVTTTGQPPYDSIEDTLVGVVNNSSQPVSSLGLNASLTVFAFDGDGIDTFGIPGNTHDSTGYGGPNAYFTNINPSQTAGTVKFVVPIAPHGGTSYFSLEEALTSATACSTLINNALSGPTLTGGGILHGATDISAKFTPNLGKTLSEAAELCGFKDFDWIQKVTNLPDPSPFYEVNPANASAPIHLTSVSTPFNDPAQNGYTYRPQWVSFPFYWDPNSSGLPWSLDNNKTNFTLSAFDSPADPCISGPLGLPSVAWLTDPKVRAVCGGSTTPRGSHLGFTTHLAGVKADGTGLDLGLGYTWTSNFNGTFGGIATTASYMPADPGSGEGGIIITSVKQTTDYEFNGLVVTTVNDTTVSTLSIDDVTITEPANGSANAVFTVTLSPKNTETVLVDYFTSNGTATAPEDYQSVNGTLTFAPGQTTRTITVPINSNTAQRGNEVFFVNLMNPTNATIARGKGEGMVVDDDIVGSFQFGASAVSASETDGTATVTVLRTGDTSAAASVRFETVDITAKQSNRYTFASGTLQFAPGEASKDVKVSLIDNAIVEGNQTFQVSLSNPSDGWGMGNPNSILVTILDDDAAPTSANPIDDAQAFVRQQYLDFLGREPDAAGLSFWVNNITSCADDHCREVKRVDTSAAFFLSNEFQETSGNVIRTQRVAFGRQSADASLRVPYLHFMRDARQVGQGVVFGQAGADTLLEQNKQDYAQQIANSPAFLARFPITPAAQYVDALYASAAVAPTAAERQAAVTAFGLGGTAGRVAALRSIADSGTLRQAEFRSSFVLAEYYGYLRRNPTDAPDFNDAGYQFWLNKMNAFNGDFHAAELVKAFIASTEYRQRFGQP
jgi:hypothetical protein